MNEALSLFSCDKLLREEIIVLYKRERSTPHAMVSNLSLR